MASYTVVRMVKDEFASFLADRIQQNHSELAARWFARLLDLLPVDARDVFPSDSLLDHVPTLIVEIGAYVRDPEANAISANTTLLQKAAELGALRHRQRASLHQVLREYHILGTVLTTFVIEEVAHVGSAAEPGSSAAVVLRLQQAVNVLSQATADNFIGLYTQTITEQSRRLEEFTRLAAHEWRQPLSALRSSITILRNFDLDTTRTARALELVDRNVAHLVQMTHKLEAVARLGGHGDSPVLQTASVTTIAGEAARQVADMADARGVEVIIQEDMPALTIDVGRLELALVNLLSNAIKYCDAREPRKYAAVTAAPAGRDGWWLIRVEDNGVGIPAASLDTVFRRFTRAHADREEFSRVSGLGLGLAIVADCALAMGGQVDVDSTEGERTTFTLTLPTSPHLA